MVNLLYTRQPTGRYPWSGLRVHINEQDLGADLNALFPVLMDLSRMGVQPVHIFATRDCPFQAVIAVVDSCRRAGYGDVRFTLPMRKKGGGVGFWQL